MRHALEVAAPGEPVTAAVAGDETVPERDGWDSAATALNAPPGWSLQRETHEDVPQAAGAPLLRSHTLRYAKDPTKFTDAIHLQVLEAVDGQHPPLDIDAIRQYEPAVRELRTERTQRVLLLREEAGSFGLTIAEWDETPRLRVSVSARGAVSVEMLIEVIGSVVIAAD